MTFAQALALAVLQGVTELFPVSSLGQTILIPALLHWKINRSDPSFLAFVTVLHLGTALALVVFYRETWVRIVRAFFASVWRGKMGSDPDEKLAWLLIVGTVPVGILGVLLKDSVQAFFGSAEIAAVFLMVNAGVMFLGEWLRKRQKMSAGRSDKPLPALTWGQSAGIGVGQALALLPGISRSGASMVAGLICDLNHEDAANYSFLLATPVILAAGLFEIGELTAPGSHVVLVQAVLGGVVAGVAAYAAVSFLVRYFRSNDLRPFGWYCLVFGALCFSLARLGVIH
ncbi:MAG TPA: undecaprenyl-diphosphate phosphatase [Candidatus Rubrimentiphilum sp.]|nr:undecaprenyl-diphosphate phosphatase [Candidatus Rubrimentiphilum sp.]